jgi:hypothetical protein
MKNLLLVIIILIITLIFINVKCEYFDNINEDEFLKVKEEKQKVLVDKISNIITYDHKCPSDTDPIIACNRTYKSVKSEDKHYCSHNVIAKFICDLSNNSYINAHYILRLFNDKSKMNDIFNNCDSEKTPCINDTKGCITKLLSCLFDKTYFARHRPLDEFKIVYNQAYNDCITNTEIISNKYALNCQTII